MIKKTDIIQTVLWLAHAMSSKIHMFCTTCKQKFWGGIWKSPCLYVHISWKHNSSFTD